MFPALKNGTNRPLGYNPKVIRFSISNRISNIEEKNTGKQGKVKNNVKA